jgi:hypothetical protein
VLVPLSIAGVAGCSRAGHPGAHGETAVTTQREAGSDRPFSVGDLRAALLTRVNGVSAVSPATSGRYAALPQAEVGSSAPSAVLVTPRACTGAALSGFDPRALAGSLAAAVTFRIAGNGVSEVLVASSAKSATVALAGHVPAKCARYEEKADGKTFRYTVKERAVKGIGEQARVVNVHPEDAKGENLWSLIYRGYGFVGSVTVIGPNSSELAVRELGQQAYAFAAKSLSVLKYGHD